MKLTIIIAALFAATTLPIKSAAQTAQFPCADRVKIIERLEARWGEGFAGGGMQSNANLFEIWFSPERGTWTILRTNAHGVACVVASGTNWQNAFPEREVAGIRG